MRICVLVVDDERPILEMFARLVRGRGIDVILVDNGDEAIKVLLSTQEIDVTFLDLRMSGTSGLEVLYECRAHAPARLERIVISTGARGKPGTDDSLDEFRLPLSGDLMPVIDKPYGLHAINEAMQKYQWKVSPRGPSFDVVPRPDAAPTQPRRLGSRPDLGVEDDEEEITGITALARSGDRNLAPVAQRLNEVRDVTTENARKINSQADELRDHAEEIEKLKRHFEITPDGKRGMVAQMSEDIGFVKTLLTRFFPIALPFLLAALAGIWWLIQSAQPKPPPTDYARIVREVSEAQGKTSPPPK